MELRSLVLCFVKPKTLRVLSIATFIWWSKFREEVRLDIWQEKSFQEGSHWKITCGREEHVALKNS